MLKKVYRKDLAEGMRFSANVFFDDGANMLVAKGVPLKARELDALDRWKIPYVLTAGSVVTGDFPVSDSVDEVVDLEEVDCEAEAVVDEIEKEPAPAHVKQFSSGQEKKKTSDALKETPAIDELAFTSEQILKLPAVLVQDSVYEAYTGLITELDAIYSQLKEGSEGKSRAIDRLATNLLALIQTNRSEVVGFILGGEIVDMDLAKSSVNTAILSTIIATHLEFPRHRIMQVAIAALLHDVGMLRVPDAIVRKEGKLDDGELYAMRSHANYGYKIIVNDLLYPDEVGKAAMHHHERWDGTGYPAGLAGDRIELIARIISVADAFEAMVSPRSLRDSMVGYLAMKNLLSDNCRRFDPEVIKAMIQCMGIFPIGSLVLLNNSAIARVVESHREAPLRPVLRILVDEFGTLFPQNEGELIDLLVNRNLFIARAIDTAEYRSIA